MASNDKKFPDATTTTNDADNTILISTDSEGFTAWTLVTENNESQTTDHVKDEAHGSYVEEVKEAREEEGDDDDKQQKETKTNDDGDNHVMEKITNAFDGLKPSLEDNSLDEFSDGISIISESESSERLSPHPSLRQYLGEFNSKLLENSDYDSFDLTTTSLKEPIVIAASAINTSNSERQLRRRTRSSPSDNSRAQALRPVSNQWSDTLLPLTPLQTVRGSLKAVFYFGVILGLLGFVGRLFLPGWGPTATTESLEQLAQKFNDMELQNNLMRAEIDILTKQINYLNSLNDQTRKVRDGQTSRQRDSDPYYKDHKTKGYQSDGVKNDTAKEEFKRKPLTATKSETNKDNIGKKGQEAEMKNRGNYELPMNAEQNKDQPKGAANNDNFHKRKKMEEKFNKDYSNKQEYKAKKDKYENYENGPNSHERHYGDDDHHFQKKKSKQSLRDDSKERYDKKSIKNSKDNSQKREGSSKEKKNDDWHEKYMNNRANERHSNEKKRNDNNWFIERGSGREHMRYS